MERLTTNMTHDSSHGASFQERVRLYIAVLSGLNVFLWAVIVLARVSLDDAPIGIVLVDLDLMRHLATAAVCGGLVAIASRRRVSRRKLLLVDAGASAFVSLSVVLGIALRPPAMRPEQAALLVLVVVLVGRSIVVPSSARRTLVIGLFALAPLLLLAPLFFPVDAVVAGVPHRRLVVVTVLAFGTAVLALTTMTSKILYDLRRTMAHATKLGPYEIGRKLGEGGMGTVYEARHTLLRRRTALKLMKPSQRDVHAEARFEREARLTSELDHPNTVALFDYGRTVDGIDYYAMEYVDGLTLHELVRKTGPVAPARAVVILKQVAASLAQAHGRGLIHRDVKPSNVMICYREGRADCVKVLDFGLAEHLVASGEFHPEIELQVGTPEYMAPEVVYAPDRVGPPADIYAVGIVAYFLLTGSLPFEDRDLRALARAHRDMPPLWPSLRTRADIPTDLEDLILKCLAKDPSDRFADGRALLEAVDACRDVGTWSDRASELWWDNYNEGGAMPVERKSLNAPTRTEAASPNTEPFALVVERGHTPSSLETA